MAPLRHTTMTNLNGKIIVGSEEWCSFPDAGLPTIKAQVDSGAATSALHAINITPFERQGSPWVSFEAHPLHGDRTVVVRHEAPVQGKRDVRNSGGSVETRYVIKERLVLGEQSWEVELTLANRDAMGYRMLPGCQAMVGHILVDPEGSHHLREISPEESRALYAHAEKPKNGLRIVLLAQQSKPLQQPQPDRGRRGTRPPDAVPQHPPVLHPLTPDGAAAAVADSR